ncbi:MAG: hypothetical protein RLY78_1661 [Pseudomonadota bacterium]
MHDDHPTDTDPRDDPPADAAWGFAPPAFNPTAALDRLRRGLREAGLSERAGVWEARGGLAVARVSPPTAQATTLDVARAVRLRRSGTDWRSHTLRHDADLRHFLDELRRLLAGARDADD